MKSLSEQLKQRILILDGAMGTMIQGYELGEAEYRGERFADWSCDLKGNNDLLCLTQAQIIKDIHCAYLEAGADILETNTFNANAVSMADYDMQELVYEINKTAAEIARQACDDFSSADKPRYVAGVLGPTNRTASLSPDVNNPGFRNITFDELREAYDEALRGLVDGGSDIILVETVFDTLNAKAALFAIDDYFEEICRKGFERIRETLQNKKHTIHEYTQRLDYEIEKIREMGFPGYFLIVWDIIRFSKERGIPVGPGRGSVVGSLVAYVMGITTIDPLEYDLIFERFLNPERISMPDIDIDFDGELRDEVIKYIRETYGEDNTAQIVTFGKMKAKMAIRDIGRVLEIPLGDVNKLAKMIFMNYLQIPNT